MDIPKTLVGIVHGIGATCRNCLSKDEMARSVRNGDQLFYTWDMESHYRTIACTICDITFGDVTDELKNH